MARKKQRARFGNVRQLPSGKYQARYGGPDGAQHKAPATFQLRGDAWSWLESEERLIALGLWKPPRKRLAEAQQQSDEEALTVRVWIEQWLELKNAEGRKPSTLKNYRNRLQWRLLGDDVPTEAKQLADTPVAAVTASQAREWWSAITKAWPDKGSTNKKAFEHVRSAFKYLVEEERLAANPIVVKAANVNPLPKYEKPLFTNDELASLYRHTPTRYKVVIALTLFHGIRIGEALGLRRKHVLIDTIPLPTGVEGPLALSVAVKIEDNVQRIDGQMLYMGSPKTKAGLRTVPIVRLFHADIWNHLNEFTDSDPEAILNTTRTGATLQDSGFRTTLKRTKEKAGVTKRVHAHAGRRFLTTALLEQGVEPQVVGEIIGDSDLSVVLEVYAQVRAGRTSEVMETLGKGLQL